MSDKKITCVADFVTWVNDIESNKNQDTELFYRGVNDGSYPIAPSIFRDEEFLANEHKMIADFKRNYPQQFEKRTNAIDQLIYMQHHGLPTRLLDITSNPLVALFFACYHTEVEILEDRHKVDGEVLLFKNEYNTTPKETTSDTVTVLANVAMMGPEFNLGDLDWAITQEKPFWYNNDKDIQDKKIEDLETEQSIIVKCSHTNPRIIRQHGAFILFGYNKNEQTFTKIIPSKGKTPSSSVEIPCDNKEAILKQLAHLGIYYASLFPEEEHYAKHLTNIYKTKKTT